MSFLKRVPTRRVPVLKDDEILVELKQGRPGTLIGRGTQMEKCVPDQSQSQPSMQTTASLLKSLFLYHCVQPSSCCCFRFLLLLACDSAASLFPEHMGRFNACLSLLFIFKILSLEIISILNSFQSLLSISNSLVPLLGAMIGKYRLPGLHMSETPPARLGGQCRTS